MRETRSIRNPFKSIHAAALINLGEATGGFAMVAWQEDPSQTPGIRAIPTRLEGVFKKKARGNISCTVSVPGATGANGGVGAMLKEGENEAVRDVVAILKDSTGEVVAEVTASWTIRRETPRVKSHEQKKLK
ncbi:hypothetical protein HDU76_007434 [Blyttiomyces sp. JEL0837]|nr:hypothetical protein HDU76_007434 [Blyttiomyces sp. JEL0837]